MAAKSSSNTAIFLWFGNIGHLDEGLDFGLPINVSENNMVQGVSDSGSFLVLSGRMDAILFRALCSGLCL